MPICGCPALSACLKRLTGTSIVILHGVEGTARRAYNLFPDDSHRFDGLSPSLCGLLQLPVAVVNPFLTMNADHSGHDNGETFPPSVSNGRQGDLESRCRSIRRHMARPLAVAPCGPRSP